MVTNYAKSNITDVLGENFVIIEYKTSYSYTAQTEFEDGVTPVVLKQDIILNNGKKFHKGSLMGGRVHLDTMNCTDSTGCTTFLLYLIAPEYTSGFENTLCMRGYVNAAHQCTFSVIGDVNSGDYALEDLLEIRETDLAEYAALCKELKNKEDAYDAKTVHKLELAAVLFTVLGILAFCGICCLSTQALSITVILAILLASCIGAIAFFCIAITNKDFKSFTNTPSGEQILEKLKALEQELSNL